MPHHVAVRNLFNTKEVVFSNEELLKVIDYAIKNNLISFELKQLNTIAVFENNLCQNSVVKEKDKTRVEFHHEGIKQAEIHIFYKSEEKEEQQEEIKPLDRSILS